MSQATFLNNHVPAGTHNVDCGVIKVEPTASSWAKEEGDVMFSIVANHSPEFHSNLFISGIDQFQIQALRHNFLQELDNLLRVGVDSWPRQTENIDFWDRQ